MTKMADVRWLAAQALSVAAEQIQNAATQIAGSGVSKALVRTAELAGLPETRIGRVATSALRFSAAKLGEMNPKPAANIPSLPTEILGNIADQLDRKTLTNFAPGSQRFAAIAGGAVRDLTFTGPAELREGMDWLDKENHARFHERGLESLSLTHGQFDADDLKAIPDWVRTTLRSLVLERPLTDAGWQALGAFPNLYEVQMQQSDGYGAAELARLPKSLTQLHLRMPATPEALRELQQFGSLKRVEVTLEPGATLDDVLAQFSAAKPDDANAAGAEHLAQNVERPLRGVEIAAVNYPKDQSFDEADLAKLPISLKTLSLPRQTRLSVDALKQLEGIKLRSLEMNHAPNLSGAMLKTLLQHPTLRRLRSEASNLNANDAKAIAASPRLTEVALRFNDRIGDEGIHALLTNTRIGVIDIGRCGASDRLLLRLHKTKPSHVTSLNLTA